MTRHSNSDLTADRARHLLAYDAETGSLTWRNPTARAVKIGDAAGTRAGKNNNYRYVSLDGTLYLAHRVAWLMFYGKWPDGDVGARNDDFDDLRIGNLFVRSAADTILSRKGPTKAKSGIRGVYPQPNGKWSAQIRRHYQMMHLGTFPTKEAAAAAIEEAKKLPLDEVSSKILVEAATESRNYGLINGLWKRTLRDHTVVSEWQSLRSFSADIGTRAYPQCRLVAIDPDKPLGPTNFKIEARSKFDRRTPEGRKAYYDYKNKHNSEAKMGHFRMSRYGISHQQYTEMLLAQKGLCAICNLPETAVHHGRVITLSVDHDHATGEIRGLLCRDCNHAIGKLKDSPVNLRAAADYIEHHAAKQKSVPASNVVHLKTKER